MVLTMRGITVMHSTLISLCYGVAAVLWCVCINPDGIYFFRFLLRSIAYFSKNIKTCRDIVREVLPEYCSG